MNLYKVRVIVILPRTLFVEAENLDEAFEIARREYPNGKSFDGEFIVKKKDILTS